VFGSLFDDLKRKIDDMLKIAVAGAIAAAAGTVAFFCLAIALFLWMQQIYGTLEAWLSLAALFVGVAAVAGVVVLAIRNRPAVRSEKRERNEEPSMISKMLQEPAVLLTGLQLMRMLGARNILPVILLGAVAGGLLMGRNGHSQRDPHDYPEEHGIPAE
jgi:hypothetical protein